MHIVRLGDVKIMSLLRTSEEEVVRKKMYAEARRVCDDAVREFAECAKSSIVVFVKLQSGRELRLLMNP